jgi:uncharacterized damage-inducible protein DinB
MTISELLLPEYDREASLTRKTLERVPVDKFGWKPHPKSMDMGTLATHLATLPGFTLQTMETDSFDVAPPGAPPYQPPLASSAKELLDLFDKNAADARKALAAASDEQFLKEWSLLVGGKVLFTHPRYTVIRSFILNHAVHHRAQLGVYLRLNDIPVPATYGPSADEQS